MTRKKTLLWKSAIKLATYDYTLATRNLISVDSVLMNCCMLSL